MGIFLLKLSIRMVAGYRELAEIKECFGCGGPIRTEYTISEHSVPQRIDRLNSLSVTFSRAKQYTPNLAGHSKVHSVMVERGIRTTVHGVNRRNVEDLARSD